MQCEFCQHEVNVLDSKCPACGRSLSILDGGPSGGKDFLDRMVDSVESELSAELGDLFASSNGAFRSEGHSASGDGVFWKLGRLQPLAGKSLQESGQDEWETAAEAVQQMAQFVFFSSHVQSNLLYRQRAAQTSLHFVAEDPTVNAFATDAGIEGFDAEPPLIFVLGGLTRVTRLVAAALAEHAERVDSASQQRLIQIVQQIGKRVVAGGAVFDGKDGAEMADLLSLKYSHSMARSYNAAMNMMVIAHELGHIALGHTLGQRCNLEISRNQEREADSFASSVASSSPFGDYIVGGGIFFWVIMAWIDVAAGDREAGTHPHARERLMDYIRANAEQAAAIGINGNNIERYLP